jgi:serine/threonine-protein kinase
VANNELNTIRKIRECQIPSLRKINPHIHEELERITNRALARDRSLRYQTASELYKDLSRFLYKINPEFTSQDTSLFIKTIFKDEIILHKHWE